MMNQEKESPRASGTLQEKRKKNPWPPNQDFRILSIDGGGIKGLLPATILSLLEKKYCKKNQNIGDCFDLIVGTSTGGLIALGLGAGMPTEKIQSIYENEGKEIFPPVSGFKKFYQGIRNYVWTKYKRDKLDQTIEKMFGSKLLGESKYNLCIPAIGAKHGGEVYVFKTPHHKDYKLDKTQKMANIAKATSAAPTYFLFYSDGVNDFIDGGVWVNNPIMIGVVEAMSAFDTSKSQIKVLSLGCIEDKYCLTEWQRYFGGILSWKKIYEAEMHFQSQNAIGQAGLLIGRENILRITAPSTTDSIEMDDWKGAIKKLPEIAQKKVEECGDDIYDMFLKTPRRD